MNPVIETLGIEDFVDIDLCRVGRKLAGMVASKCLDLNLPRCECRHSDHDNRFLVSPGWGLMDNHLFSGVRVYADGIGQRDENQVILLYDAHGELTHIVVSKWVSAFRAGVLAQMALDLWAVPSPATLVVNGLGRMGYAVCFWLFTQLSDMQAYIVRWQSPRFRCYVEMLEERFGSKRICIVEDSQMVLDEATRPVVYLVASNRPDQNKTSVLSKSGAPVYLLHVGSKYGGAWDAARFAEDTSPTVVVDSRGEFNRKRSRISRDFDLVHDLQTMILRKDKLEGSVHYLSLGATGMDVALARIVVMQKSKVGR